MTTQESFKRRVRTRMAKTGEKYGAARRALLSHARTATAPTGWVAQPEIDDDRIRERTGHGWDDWVGLIDAGPGRDAGHTAIAAWVVGEHGIDGWRAQTVTVGYERITGLRLPGQMKDGTFTVTRSRVIGLDPAQLRALLLDDGERAPFLGGLDTTLRSRPTAKALRFAVHDGEDDLGSILVSMDAVGDRLRLAVTHSKLATAGQAEHWKAFWADWLTAVEAAAEA